MGGGKTERIVAVSPSLFSLPYFLQKRLILRLMFNEFNNHKILQCSLCPNQNKINPQYVDKNQFSPVPSLFTFCRQILYPFLAYLEIRYVQVRTSPFRGEARNPSSGSVWVKNPTSLYRRLESRCGINRKKIICIKSRRKMR